MKYGFLGLGELGSQLAANLLKGNHQVTGFDLKQKAVDDLVALGGVGAPSVAAAAKGVDAIITCLSTPAAAKAVWQDILAAKAANPDDYKSLSAWIEMGTNEVEEIEALAQTLATQNIKTLAAPVSGGVHRAASAKIVVLAGGQRDVFDQHKAALALLGREVFYLGDVEQAAVTKVVTNMLAFIHLIAAGEAMMMCKKAGVDMTKAFQAIRASSGTSFVHETETQVILNGSYDIAFTLDLAVKDAGFAMMMAKRYGVPVKLAEVMQQQMLEARERFGGDAWSPKVVALLEEAVGETLRAPGFPARLAPE